MTDAEVQNGIRILENTLMRTLTDSQRQSRLQCWRDLDAGKFHEAVIAYLRLFDDWPPKISTIRALADSDPIAGSGACWRCFETRFIKSRKGIP